MGLSIENTELQSNTRSKNASSANKKKLQSKPVYGGSTAEKKRPNASSSSSKSRGGNKSSSSRPANSYDEPDGPDEVEIPDVDVS